MPSTPRVANRGGDLESVTHDTGVGQQACCVGLTVTGNARDIEIVERRAVVLAFAQNRQPTQSSLCAFEDQEFEQPPIVVQRHPPLAVVIRLIQRIVPAPNATDNTHPIGLVHRVALRLRSNHFRITFWRSGGIATGCVSASLSLCSRLQPLHSRKAWYDQSQPYSSKISVTSCR